MSSMFSGGAGRAYGYNNIENIMICPLTTTASSITSHSSSSSPSSTLSESTNSPLTISTRKPRTPRKRPNQTYNEAAVLLSIACPKVFSTKNITNKNNNSNNIIPKFTKVNGNSFHDSPELLFPIPMIENSGFGPRKPISKKPSSVFGSGFRRSSPEFNSGSGSVEPRDEFEGDFDTESILDEETEQGIDSIIGSSHSIPENNNNNNSSSESKTCYGYPLGLGFGGNLEVNFGIGMKNGIRALKNSDGGNWWGFPTVSVVNVSPPVAPVKAKKVPVEKKKKKVEELMKKPESELELELRKGNSGVRNKLLLKLNYDDVLRAWSDKGSPLPEEFSRSDSSRGDIHSKLAQIDLFSENDGLREAGVTPYKEKKRTRIFAKKIRYQVRKINGDRRPRSKGRFIRRHSPSCEDT
ncbi:protein CHLOROPLAST IMPORT APPARATUS 2-like [Bidens hawaiensis]|uniref:protein CHLOROPLAST IMPORT APPARATUS 2-like n=1 Tax=Bidens hawaiensis TaxID=980011 RepID=UPI004049264C